MQGVLVEQLFALSICILSCFQVISFCSWNQRRIKINTLKVHFLWHSCSQYPLMFKQMAHGRGSKYQGFLIIALYFLEFLGNWSLQIMSSGGGWGGVRICSGWGFLKIKNAETKNNNLISSLSQTWSNKATPHAGMFKVLKVSAVVIALFDFVQECICCI